MSNQIRRKAPTWQKRIRDWFYGTYPGEERPAAKLNVEGMATRGSIEERERIHTSQRTTAVAAYCFLGFMGMAFYISPFLTHWNRQSEIKVLERRLEKKRDGGEEMPLPETSWDKVIFGSR